MFQRRMYESAAANQRLAMPASVRAEALFELGTSAPRL